MNHEESLKSVYVSAIGILAVAVFVVCTSDVQAHEDTDDADLVHACIKTISGRTRIVGPAGTCRILEYAMHWPATSTPQQEGNAGSTFIHWGNATAPTGTTLVHGGFAFNGYYSQSGSGTAICLAGGGSAQLSSQQGDLLYPVSVTTTGGEFAMPPGIQFDSRLACATVFSA